MTGWDDLLADVHELADIAAAAGLLSWDQQTMMRPKSAESRAFQQGTIQAIHHERLTAPALRAALELSRGYSWRRAAAEVAAIAEALSARELLECA